MRPQIKFEAGCHTATAGSDYVAKQGMLTFLPGQTTKNISITINGDTQVEPNESFYVLLGFPENATIADDTAVGVIRNDDAAVIAAAANDDNAKISSSTVTLSPNPAKNQITISNASLGATITISNMNGQKILEQKINANVQAINISKLSPGIYLLDYMNGNKKQQLKFVKE
ncbi:MAG TPA: T9SS type A sorting domain-containing protein [Chitinophagaceae bacterium]|nr:T9SS type A sorting domain-containing protein [Chitinophagaceae bacterium]